MKFDFRSKIFLTLVIGVLSMGGTLANNIPIMGVILVLFPYFLAIFDKNYSFALKGFVFNLLAFSQPILLSHFKDNVIIMFLGIYYMIAIMIMPGVMMAYYTISTTKMSDLVLSLQKMRIPDPIIIPISVMFRFFYSIKEDKRTIKEAMYMHGITMRNFFKNPARVIEYKFVPLLMITSQTADNVAISAMTRGMKPGAARTSISKSKLRIGDFLLIAFGIFLIILLIKVKVNYA